jgi:hypothetical protein
MQTVTSKDGTTIAFDKVGSGPAVILVNGAMAYRAFDPSMAHLAELLSTHFTVYNYDRRGRGASSDKECIASRESSSICLPNPLLSCSSLTGPYRLKRFHSLSPNSKPVLSQRQEDDRREAGSDESVTSAFRMHGNSRDPVSEKRENVPLSHRWKLRIPRLFFTERLSFCSLSLAWISTGLFLRHLFIKPLRSLSASARGAIGHASADIV